MGEFTVNVLTGSGRALIAQATAANRLVYTRMLTREDAMTAMEAANAQLSDFDDGPVGTIAAASATGEIARIVGSVRNTGNTEVSLKTFALCGRLESTPAASPDSIVAVLSDDIPAAVLPPSGGPDNAAAIAFSLRISAGEAAMVTVTSAGSATVADLERFVSLYRAGDTAHGDDQDILGIKRFIDDIIAANVFVTNGLEVGGIAQADGGLVVGDAENPVASTIHGDLSVSGSLGAISGTSITLTGDIKADGAAELNSCIISSSLIVPTISTHSIDIAGSGGTISVDNSTGDELRISGTVSPMTSGGADLGSSVFKWGTVYARGYKGLPPHPTLPAGTTLTDSELPIGTIFMARIVSDTASHTIGEVIAITSTSAATSATVALETGGGSDYIIPVGWKLTLLQCTSSGYSTFACLVMRVE